mmetsp:Transcript_88599/g.271206  ORF Transcript_88599/g.271206 Transcript_88599/m.271206 type:complete len:247 (-) Transcript_88599:234-974(-)
MAVALQLRDHRALLRAPGLDHAIPAGAEDGSALGRPLAAPPDLHHRRGVGRQRPEARPRLRVPQADGAVLGRGGELWEAPFGGAVQGLPTSAGHRLCVPLQRAAQLPGATVPRQHGLVHASRSQAAAVGRPRHGQNPTAVAGARVPGQLGAQVPQPHRGVAGAAGQVLPVGRKSHAQDRLGMPIQGGRTPRHWPNAEHGQGVVRDLQHPLRRPLPRGELPEGRRKGCGDLCVLDVEAVGQVLAVFQ